MTNGRARTFLLHGGPRLSTGLYASRSAHPLRRTPSVVAALVLGIICLLFSFGPTAMMVTHSLAGCPPACAARRQAIWRADRKRAGSARAGRRGRRSFDRGVPVLGESPALATASPQKQSGAGFRAKLAFLFRRRRSVAKHHGAMRLEGKHTEQHARSASASSNSIAPRFCCARNQFARVSWVRVIARR